jgi:hypothetical protein
MALPLELARLLLSAYQPPQQMAPPQEPEPLLA